MMTHFFDYDTGTPIDLEEKGKEVVEGVTVHDVSYASPKGGRVPAYLVVPPGKGPFAGIIFMHWGQGDRTEFLSEALIYAKIGAVSLLIDAPHNRAESSQSKVSDPMKKEYETYIQLVIDLRRGVDLLLARKDVDSKRLGYVGHSLGATWGGALAGVEKRIKAYALVGGLPSLTDVFGDDQYAKLMQSHYNKEQLLKYTEILSPINPENFVGLAQPGSILFQFARHDRYISESVARAYEEAAGKSHEVKWYYTSHEFNDPHSCKDRREWLGKRIGIEHI